MATPPFPQGNFSVALNETARRGQVIDGTPCIINSYTANTAIPYGYAVQWHSEGKVTQGADATNFVGFAVADLANDNAANQQYEAGDTVSVLIAGTIVLENESGAAITAGSSVQVASATDGSIDAAGAAVGGALWLEATADGALGRVRVIGAQIANA